MFKSLRTIALLVAIAMLTACSSASVDPGKEGVLVQKPFFFGHGGVDPTPVRPGREFIALTTDVIMVDMVPQTTHVAFQDFSSQDNILLDFETAVQYRVTDSVGLISKFGVNWFDNNIKSQYASIVREVVKKNSMKEMMSDPAAATRADDQITEAIQKLVVAEKIPVTILNVTLGRASPNANVLNQMNNTAAEQQRKLTNDAAKLAEDSRKASEASRAIADDAYRTQMGYSVAQYAAMQIANINADACKAAKSCVLAPAGSSVLVNP